MKKLFSTICLALIIGASMVSAQIDSPQPSPLGTISQKVGLTDMSINYSRPGVKGRTIFGELLPYGEMWRLGANASTKFTTSDDIHMEGNLIPAGEYALYVIPQPETWTIIVHKNTSHWGIGEYKQEEDLVRFNVPVNNQYPIKVETMTFNIGDISSDSCTIIFTWEKTEVRIGVKTNTDEKVMAAIDKQMKGVSSATYYQAARYYLENGKDLNLALEWINKALEDNNKFWVHRQKALILSKLGRYTEAIETANMSKQLAPEADNNDYVRMNDKSIEEWKPLAAKEPKAKKDKKK